MREFEILLENVMIYAYHGVFEEERYIGNEFEVNLNVKYSAPDRGTIKEDNLGNTVSYVDLWEIVKEEMADTRQLLESVASSIAERIKSSFPQCHYIECSISKKRPPIPGFTGSAAVTYIIRS